MKIRKSYLNKLIASFWMLIGSVFRSKRKPVPIPPPPVLEPYDIRTPILIFGRDQVWTLGDALQGVQIFGGTGSGKTSGSGTAIARSYLSRGYGGLILSAKPDERELWEEHCIATGRELTIFGPGQGLYFNFLDYEYSRAGLGAGLTNNVAELLATVAEINQGKAGSVDAYWQNAMKQMLRRAVHLLAVATGTVSLPLIMDLIMSAAQTLDEAESATWKATSFLAKCLCEAETKRTEQNGPDLDHTRRFWMREFPALGDRTRSSIVSMITVIADGFLAGPIRELFCTRLNIFPEETHAGRIIFVDLPVEVYSEIGVCAQMVWKYCWQRATARREPGRHGIPTFLWADESQFFTSSNDHRFQAMARSKRACTVYLTQNLPTYFDRVGKDRTEALLGNLQTKILHANGDHITNSFAADTISRGVMSRSSMNVQAGGGVSIGASEAVDYIVPPAAFQNLRKGGPENGNMVDGYIFQAGRKWASTCESVLKATFVQPQRKA